MLIFDHTSTGASDDLAKATDIAHDIVARYGMDEKLGSVVYEDAQTPFLGNVPLMPATRKYSEATAQQIDETVRAVIKTAFDRATEILSENRDVLEACAAEILKTETLEQSRLKELTAPMRKTHLKAV